MGALPWVLMALGIILLVLGAIYVAGSFMARTHTVSRGLVTQQTPEALWQIITDFESIPTWHAGVKKVERLPDRNGHALWRETYQGNYPMLLETVEVVAPRRLVRAIADEKGPFTGRWVFELTPVEGGSRLTVTEHGEIANPFFRFMARLYMNPAMYLDMYLMALGSRVGATPPKTNGADKT